MRRATRWTTTTVAVVSIGAASSFSQAPSAPDAALQALTVPAGFEVIRAAGPPLVDRPIVADFDEAGRLYVAESSGSNDKVEQQLAQKPHRILRLEDTNGDGVFDARVVFADRMMFPEGTMWLDGSLYVSAPPSIWKLTDTNGDGVADQREEWFEGKTLTGCANDLHGPYLGLDGWIYWTKGAFAEQAYAREGKGPFVTRAAHIFRRRPGTTLVEPVMTGGMDNPVDVAFTPSGERILTATFLEHPQLGRRDALIHAIYGGVYGKPHAVLDGHKRTGELMPELTHLGPAAPSGLTRYASRVFGDEFRDNFFAAMFNLQKVTRHALEPKGATFASRDSDFLVSSSRDFHPTDVVEDADGSLLVIDTGAWYKLCCPSSQLAAPDVLGGIYRVRRRGAKPPADPRGLRLRWEGMTAADLSRLLDDSRPAVQTRVLAQFAKLGPPAVPALDTVLRGAGSEAAKVNAVWALTRIDAPAARAAVRGAARDRFDSVRRAAMHSISAWRDREALPQAIEAVGSASQPTQRAGAEALGRIGDASAVGPLLAAAAKDVDRTLEHSLTYALIEIDAPAATEAGLRSPSSRARRAALVALDQMDNGRLTADVVVPLLESSDPLLNDTAWWIASHHPEWGGAMAQFFRKRLTEGSTGEAARADLQRKLALFGGNADIQRLLAEIVASSQPEPARITALRSMQAAGLKQLPAPWTTPLVGALTAGSPEIARHAVSVLRATPVAGETAELSVGLSRLADNPDMPGELRLAALAAMPGKFALRDQPFTFVTASLDPSMPASTRAEATAVIEKLTLKDEQLRALTTVLASVGPLELPRLLPAFDQGSDEALGLAMIAALERAKARSSLRADMIRPRLAKYPASVQARGEALIASLHADSAQQAKRLESLVAGLTNGDVRRGQAIFNSPKAACLSCHAIGYLGGKIGPDLTRIGQIRSERDLLEAIVFPNASFARGYEPVMVTMSSGAVHMGVVRSERPDELVLATGAGAETRIARPDIEDIQPGSVSVMPEGLADQLTPQELADLLAFLKATRWGAN